MAKVKYIGSRYFVRHWGRWYHLELEFYRPDAIAFPIKVNKEVK